MIESPVLARRLSEVFDVTVPVNAYEVSLSGRRTQWVERRGDTNVVHDTEPGTRWSPAYSLPNLVICRFSPQRLVG